MEQFSGDQKGWGSGPGHGLLNEVTVSWQSRINGCWMGCHIDTQVAGRYILKAKCQSPQWIKEGMIGNYVMRMKERSKNFPRFLIVDFSFLQIKSHKGKDSVFVNATNICWIKEYTNNDLIILNRYLFTLSISENFGIFLL